MLAQKNHDHFGNYTDRAFQTNSFIKILLRLSFHDPIPLLLMIFSGSKTSIQSDTYLRNIDKVFVLWFHNATHSVSSTFSIRFPCPHKLHWCLHQQLPFFFVVVSTSLFFSISAFYPRSSWCSGFRAGAMQSLTIQTLIDAVHQNILVCVKQQSKEIWLCMYAFWLREPLIFA